MEKPEGIIYQRRLEPEFGKWSLMGGFVNHNESVEQAAARVLNR